MYFWVWRRNGWILRSQSQGCIIYPVQLLDLEQQKAIKINLVDETAHLLAGWWQTEVLKVVTTALHEYENLKCFVRGNSRDCLLNSAIAVPCVQSITTC